MRELNSFTCLFECTTKLSTNELGWLNITSSRLTEVNSAFQKQVKKQSSWTDGPH